MDEKWPESAVNSAMIVLDFDGKDPLLEENIRTMHRWMDQKINDSRVIDAFGYAMHPLVGLNETAAVEFWLTPDENLTLEQITTREYMKVQFISDNVTYVIFSLEGPITGEDSRDFVADVRDDKSELLDELSSNFPSMEMVPMVVFFQCMVAPVSNWPLSSLIVPDMDCSCAKACRLIRSPAII